LDYSHVFWTNFRTADWIIVAVYCLASIGIGVYANRFVGNLADFIVAGRSLRLWLGLATMTGTEIGLVTLMYQAEGGLRHGFAFYYTGIIWGLAFLLVGSTGFIVRKLREMRCMTIPEFYARRYSRPTRILGGFILAFSGILNMGQFLRAGAEFVGVATGMEAAGVGVTAVMASMLAIVLCYTILGGMISVVITDLIQFIVLGFGILIATIFAVSQVGWFSMVDGVRAFHGYPGFNPFAAGNMGPTEVVWQTFGAIAACALWETATLRALASSDPKTASRMYAGSSITFAGRFILPATWGIAALAYLRARPHLFDPFLDANAQLVPEMTLKAMPLFLAQNIPTIVLGVLCAGMFAAFMSTHDSYFIAWSAVLTQDVINPLRRRSLTQRQRIQLTRIIIACIGAFVFAFGLYYRPPEGLWDFMLATGSVYFAGAFVVIVAGMYWRRASSMGANLALLGGLFSLLSLVHWKDRGLEWITTDKVGLVTVGLCVLGMVVGSLLFPDREPPREGLVERRRRDEPER
jgi:SSS family solute:Na+ symporter